MFGLFFYCLGHLAMLWGLSAHQINLPYSHLGALTAYLSPNIKEESGRQEH